MLKDEKFFLFLRAVYASPFNVVCCISLRGWWFLEILAAFLYVFTFPFHDSRFSAWPSPKHSRRTQEILNIGIGYAWWILIRHWKEKHKRGACTREKCFQELFFFIFTFFPLHLLFPESRRSAMDKPWICKLFFCGTMTTVCWRVVLLVIARQGSDAILQKSFLSCIDFISTQFVILASLALVSCTGVWEVNEIAGYDKKLYMRNRAKNWNLY